MWDKDRTVVVSGVPDVLPASRMVDKLTIHFQTRRRSHGGDVEVVAYPTNMDGVAFVTFDEATDAERVVRKEQHVMADGEFPEDYVLTVYPFTRDVFLYVASAVVDLSGFGSNQAALIQSLRSAHRSIRFQPLLEQRKATIEGPFAAVKALREDLNRRASQRKSTAQTAAAKPKETPLNPRVISRHRFVSSVSRGGSKAKLEPASSNSLSAPPQTTGEAAQVQTLLSKNAQTRKASLRQKVSSGRLVAGSFCSTDSDEEEQRGRPRLQMPTEYKSERAKANTGHVFGGEINAGIRFSLSGLDLLPAEEISAKQPPEDGVSQKHARPDSVSAAKIRGANRLGSHYGSSDYLKESDQNSSSVTAKLLQSRLTEVSPFSESSATKGPSPEHPDDTCIWVDSYTFRYIVKFDRDEFDRCLRGLDVSIECAEGSDLTRISLADRRTSRTTSRIQQASSDLSSLVASWLSRLRVNEVKCDEVEQREELIRICDDVSFLFDDILYVLEDSCVKVIGPSVSSHLFYRRVEDRKAKLKDRTMRV